MKSFIRFFSSVKLAIVLFIIITCASIIGTLIPQLRSTAEYSARYGELAPLFIKLQLTALYHSWWFILLLFLFCLNIIVCTLTRLSAKLKRAFRAKISFDKKSIKALKITSSFRKNWNAAKTGEALMEEFSARNYRLKRVSKGSTTFLLARKRVLGLFGADIVHLGILIILFGGIVSGIAGFRKNLSFSEGQILPVPGAEFKLKLDRFETELYPNGAVKDWKSTLTVVEEEKPVRTKTIEVNHPLSYKGYTFYQHSYGWNWQNPTLEIWVKKRNDPSFLKKIELGIGEKRALGEENIQIVVLHFIPDLIINERNQITTRSLEPNNPAAFLEGWEGEEKIFSGWIFARFPDFSRIHSEKETELVFELRDFRSSQYSVIQAARDPGTNIIWVGCSFIMLGLFFAFYWPWREMRIILEESEGKTEVFLGGIASKSKDAFQSEFESIVIAARRAK
ncbi:MAG: cytochrome c biogenesis protein ResB [Candidatus Aminicenantales bacterium]